MDMLRRLFPQYWPRQPAPLTENNLPSQAGKVIIVTGSTSGLGYELARILYQTGATVYMAARCPSKAEAAMQKIKEEVPTVAGGNLKFLFLDLADLRTIRPFTEAYLKAESRLDVLFNNAGVGPFSKGHTAQGLEGRIGINCVGPYLLTKLLSPILISTAERPETPENSVRVVWTGGWMIDSHAPKDGVPISELDAPSQDAVRNYGISKTGNWFFAAQFAKRLGPHGVISIAVNPGTLRTPIFDKSSRFLRWILEVFLLYDVIHGANTLLWGGFAEGMTPTDGGRLVIPWGRWHPFPRKDLENAIKDKEHGGKGIAKEFEEWCDDTSRAYSLPPPETVPAPVS